jgi:hypothetical protein
VGSDWLLAALLAAAGIALALTLASSGFGIFCSCSFLLSVAFVVAVAVVSQRTNGLWVVTKRPSACWRNLQLIGY